MKVVLTLVVRDEADIVGDMVRFHLEHGVDLVLATDHRSVDGTTDILRSYEREGCLHLIREEGAGIRQIEWVTRMARLAATDFGADWVINSDADEFWWARDGTVKDVLEAVPPRFGAVRGIWRHFVPRPRSAEPFWQRMTVRGRSLEVAAPYWPTQVKVVHRADPSVEISDGNHDAYGRGLVLLRDWFPFEIFHFPIRSPEQMERKFLVRKLETPEAMGGSHVNVMLDAMDARSGQAVFDELVVDDDVLQAGLADGSLAVDTRLAGALSAGERTVAPSLADDVLLAEEFEALMESEGTVRLHRRIESVERRIGELRSAATLRTGSLAARAVPYHG